MTDTQTQATTADRPRQLFDSRFTHPHSAGLTLACPMNQDLVEPIERAGTKTAEEQRDNHASA